MQFRFDTSLDVPLWPEDFTLLIQESVKFRAPQPVCHRFVYAFLVLLVHVVLVLFSFFGWGPSTISTIPHPGLFVRGKPNLGGHQATTIFV